jgi:hypothetical protein
MIRPLHWEGLDAMAYALVAVKMLAGGDRLVTEPVGKPLWCGVSEGEVWRAGDELVARGGSTDDARRMVDAGERSGREEADTEASGGGRISARNLPYWSRSVCTVSPSTRKRGFPGRSTVMNSSALPAWAAATCSASIAAMPDRCACSEASETKP